MVIGHLWRGLGYYSLVFTDKAFKMGTTVILQVGEAKVNPCFLSLENLFLFTVYLYPTVLLLMDEEGEGMTGDLLTRTVGFQAHIEVRRRSRRTRLVKVSSCTPAYWFDDTKMMLWCCHVDDYPLDLSFLQIATLNILFLVVSSVDSDVCHDIDGSHFFPLFSSSTHR